MSPNTPTRPGVRPRPANPGWLDRLLTVTERARSWQANSVFMAVIVIISLVLSIAIGAILGPTLGQPSGAGLLGLAAVIGVSVPLIVGLPAVLFGDAMVRRIKAMRHDLQNALTETEVASRAKSDFLATMSHEIRTPLNGILGMAQALESTPLTTTQSAHLRVIRESGDMLTAVIDDVLDLARIESGRIDLNPAPVALPQVLSGTVELFRARAAEHGTALRFVVAPGTPDRAEFDSVRVRQCLGNLVSNAVKFTRDGVVTVTLSARPDGASGWQITLAVADTGIGIDPAAQARLFKPFDQAEHTTARDYGGTGLGLAISRKLARQMGGDITLTSAPGAGSCFAFSFHAATAEPLPAETTTSAANCAGNEHLQGLVALVVDDSTVNRRVACCLLEPMGVTCHEAEDGAQALRMLAEAPVGLVLLDMHMPEMDGPATMRAIRASGQAWAGVPVIAVTADAMPGERAHCLAIGMQGYVAKPVQRAALHAEIARVLALTPPPAKTVAQQRTFSTAGTAR